MLFRSLTKVRIIGGGGGGGDGKIVQVGAPKIFVRDKAPNPPDEQPDVVFVDKGILKIPVKIPYFLEVDVMSA